MLSSRATAMAGPISATQSEEIWAVIATVAMLTQ